MVMDFTQAVTWAISLLGIFSTLVFGLVKLLLSQMEKRLGERFASQERRLPSWRSWSATSCASRQSCLCSTSTARPRAQPNSDRSR
ncbi:hypothetical protein [Ectopseudomonas oleovorans]|uniref:hypothetical protein n=1 Tax=Ectopseudomonas oleovorans TaxID=301 RepID=UPI003F1C53FB